MQIFVKLFILLSYNVLDKPSLQGLVDIISRRLIQDMNELHSEELWLAMAM
jgi:hypothetical protein